MKFVCFLLALIGMMMPVEAAHVSAFPNGIDDGSEVLTVDLPIVMYHKVKNSTGKYIITPEQLEDDFTAILESGFTPVFMSEVIDWVDGHGELPAKPIVITFDDGYYNNLYYGVPLAQKLGIKFMFNPVTEYSRRAVNSKEPCNPAYSYATWDQMKEAVDSGVVEIGNHSHKMHEFKPRFGIARLSSESHEEYAEALKNDILQAQAILQQCGIPKPLTFAYPFGKYSKEGREVLCELGFRAMLTCTEKVSKVTKGDPTSLYNLGRFNRDGGMSTARLIKNISKV